MTYKWKKKTFSEALGWEGDFVKNEDEAYALFLELKQNRKDKTPPFTLKERNQLREDDLEQEQVEQEKKRIEQVTFVEIFKSYLDYSKANKRSEKSWQREEQLCRLHILPVVKNTPIKTIAPFHLERVKKNMASSGLSPRSIRYALAVVRQVFNYAIRESLYTGPNPAAEGKVVRPQADNKKTRFLTRDEAKSLLNELGKRSVEVHDMALLSLYSGMRFGEVANLKWGDVDLFQGNIMLRNTKSGKNRAAFLTPDIRKMLAKRGPGAPDKLVFPARGTTNTPHNRISRIFYDVVKKLFNENVIDKTLWVNFHTCRHTFASWLVEEGTNIYLVKDLLGHSDLKLTERYAHIGENQLKDAVMKLQKNS
ncbi:MAG: tyrosine-type recombinase/integrase [Desulforhopalus sp.]